MKEEVIGLDVEDDTATVVMGYKENDVITITATSTFKPLSN